MKFYIDTLGCPKNIVDSENAAGVLERAGHEITRDPVESDIIIVNTCGFINDAKEESIDRIFEMASIKEEGKYLAVTGCLSQRYGEELYKAMPEVDMFLGVDDYDNLPELLEELEKGKRILKKSGAPLRYRELGDRKNPDNPYTTYIKISEGCNNVCAYCSIPAIRGPYRSRKENEILKEAERLAKMGCKEVILVAQDVTAYGMDLNGEYHLPALLEKLCLIDGISWIRLMYCYEDRITPELISVISKNDKICKYIDIPLQHASDNILTAMNRRSTNDSIRKTICALREAMPDIHIRTTVITGFPGEKAEEFKELLDFISEMKFERLGVFAYSREEGTEAANMSHQVRKDVKARRRDKIMAVQKDISLDNNRKHIGKTMEVLVEDKDDETTYIGRTRYDAPEVDNGIIFTSYDELMPGDLVKVKITDAFDYDLSGEIIKEDGSHEFAE